MIRNKKWFIASCIKAWTSLNNNVTMFQFFVFKTVFTYFDSLVPITKGPLLTCVFYLQKI